MLKDFFKADNGACLIAWRVPSEIMDLGDRIKMMLVERRSDGISQSGLARACGVSPASVSQWVRGPTKDLRMENLVAVADYLGVEIRWLATGEGPKYMDHKEAWLDIGDLSPESQAALRALLRSLKDQGDSDDDALTGTEH